MRRLVGYVRVSTTLSAEQGESPDIQREQIAKFADYKGWKLTKYYEDLGISGKNAGNRPSFQKMIRDAEKKKFDGVVVSKLSRCARNTRELLIFVDKLKQNDIRFFTIAENVDSKDKYAGKLLMQILSVIAEWDRETIELTMKEGKARKWKDKRCFIGQPPYGYYFDKKDCKVKIHEQEKKVYLRILDLYLNVGLSYKDISLRLAEEGVYREKYKKKGGKTAKQFTTPMISYLLKHPAYYGKLISNQFFYKDGRVTKEMKPETEWVHWDIEEPMITKSKWDATQEKVKFNITKGKRIISAEDYWLRDLLTCDECGGKIKPVHGVISPKTGKFPRYYRCYWSKCSKKDLKMRDMERCYLPSIKAEKLENLIWMKLNFKLSLGKDENSLKKLIDPKRYDRQINKWKRRLSVLGNDLKKSTKAKDKLYNLFSEDDDFDKNDLLKHINIRKEEILDIKGQIKDTQKQIDDLEDSKANDKLWANFVKNEAEVIMRLKTDIVNLPPADKKRLIESMINGDGIRIHGDSREKGKPWHPTPYRLQFNLPILLDLIEQGKISSLDKKGVNSPANDKIS
jgi:site-specific DNA recombinase